MIPSGGSESGEDPSSLPPYEPLQFYDNRGGGRGGGGDDGHLGQRSNGGAGGGGGGGGCSGGGVVPRRWSADDKPTSPTSMSAPAFERSSVHGAPTKGGGGGVRRLTNPTSLHGANSSSDRTRSLSLQHPHRGGGGGVYDPAGYYSTRVASPYYTDHNPGRHHFHGIDDGAGNRPELITLDNMPKELGVLSKEKKSSISFSAVSFMVDTMQKLHSRITDKKPDVERAVAEGDIPTLRLLCDDDEAAAAVAAFAAAREDQEAVLEEVLSLLKEGTDLKALVDEGVDGDGLLHVAAGAGAARAAATLISRGFGPSAWNRAGTATPMHAAAASGEVDLLRSLADEAGGDLNAGKDSNDDDRPSVIQTAVAADRRDAVRFLLGRKVAKMKRGKFTETALHTAARHNHHECAALLLDDGVMVDAQGGGSARRETALHLASANGYRECAELLLARSADPNARNARGETPLHQAAATLSAPVMRALADAGADVDARDCDGRPPLHFAVNSMQKGSRACMQLLLDRGADINLGDANGYTALHLAALSRRLGRVRLLISGGADLCMRNNAGKSALHFVMKYVPNSLRTIEERMDGGLQLDVGAGAGKEEGGGGTVKMNFNLLIPSPGNHGVSEVGLFTEILQMHNNDPARLEKILMHPLSLSFLHLKWQQMKWLYYFMILSSHLIYSLTYSIYAILVFSCLCKPPDDLRRHGFSARVGLEITCSHMLDRNYVTERAFALSAWWGCSSVRTLNWMTMSLVLPILLLYRFLLIVFNIMYLLKETTKLLHLRDRYFREWESCLNMLTIVSFPLISFHQDPFSEDEVKFVAWQFHAAGVGVLVTW